MEGAGGVGMNKMDTVPPLSDYCLAECLYLLTENLISSLNATSLPFALHCQNKHYLRNIFL